MLARIKNLAILFSVVLLSEVCLALDSQRMKTKLFGLLYIIVPMALIVATFFILEWRRKRNLKTEKLVDLPVGKNKK